MSEKVEDRPKYGEKGEDEGRDGKEGMQVDGRARERLKAAGVGNHPNHAVRAQSRFPTRTYPTTFQTAYPGEKCLDLQATRLTTDSERTLNANEAGCLPYFARLRDIFCSSTSLISAPSKSLSGIPSLPALPLDSFLACAWAPAVQEFTLEF